MGELSLLVLDFLALVVIDKVISAQEHWCLEHNLLKYRQVAIFNVTEREVVLCYRVSKGLHLNLI
jgi:hypothetical protein